MTRKAGTPVAEYNDREGYRKDFISHRDLVPLPDFSRVADIFKPKLKTKSPFEIPYHHFSVILHMKRKFPLFTAANIDGSAFQDTRRVNSWRKDPRVERYQCGNELYAAKKSDFDKGHMTRREDPAWGMNREDAFRADQDTFHFTNAVPQVHKLNGYAWKELEDHVLHFGAVEAGLRICVFTGPVLAKDDPMFVTAVHGREMQIPSRFWKIIVWKKKRKGLHAVGFVMSQENDLIENRIVAPIMKTKRALPADDVFENITFKGRTPYQVPIRYIERITGIAFTWKNVSFPYAEKKARAVTRMRATDRDISLRGLPNRKGSGYQIKNVLL